MRSIGPRCRPEPPVASPRSPVLREGGASSGSSPGRTRRDTQIALRPRPVPRQGGARRCRARTAPGGRAGVPRAVSRDGPFAVSAPTERIRIGTRREGSRSAASETNRTPPDKRASARAAASSARRVFPMPPGPVRVRSRTPGSASVERICSSSRSRPINGVCRASNGHRRRPPSDAARAAPSPRSRGASGLRDLERCPGESRCRDKH